MTILPRDAREKGIVSAAVRLIAEEGLSIRQIFVTDPLLSEEPRLVVIIEGEFPPTIIEGIRRLPQVRQVTF